MSNKKGGIAIEEFTGALSFIFIAVILLLFFYGCSISNAKKEYEQFEYSKDDVQVIKNLNSFLQVSVGDEIMSDLLIIQLEKLLFRIF